MTHAAFAIAIAMLLGAPEGAPACATCIANAYGDRSYNVAYIGLILTPFAVAVTVGAVITRSWWLRRAADTAPDSQLNEGRENAPAPVGREPAPVENT